VFRINLFKHADNLMASVATRRPYTGEAGVRSQTIAMEFVLGDWRLGQVPLTPRNSVFLFRYYSPSAPYLCFLHLPLTLYNLKE
jgi:hypothetical protein